MKPGDTFLGGGEVHGTHHLWVVVNDPAAHGGEAVIVNVSTQRPGAETTCVLNKGEHRLECAVCGMGSFGLFLPCRGCGKPAPRMFEIEIACQWCGRSHKADAEESFEWARKAFPTVSPRAWCGDCGYTITESVIEIEGASLCLACHSFNEGSDISRCPWCASDVTGPVGNRTTPGCVRCHYDLQFGETDEESPEILARSGKPKSASFSPRTRLHLNGGS